MREVAFFNKNFFVGKGFGSVETTKVEKMAEQSKYKKKAQKENTNVCQVQPEDTVSFFFRYLKAVNDQMIHSVVTKAS